MMHKHEHQDDPNRVYNEELSGKGSTFSDTPYESDARDQAKIEKAAAGETQKMDGGNPFAEEDTVSDEDIARETYDDAEEK